MNEYVITPCSSIGTSAETRDREPCTPKTALLSLAVPTVKSAPTYEEPPTDIPIPSKSQIVSALVIEAIYDTDAAGVPPPKAAVTRTP